MTTVLLGAGYELGNSIGVISGWVLTIAFVIIWIWVMFKYLNTSNLK